MSAVALAGWLAAAAAVGAAVLLRAELTRRGELVARACHELRGPLAAARLGLATLARPGNPVASRAVAIDGELRRAGLALEDLDAARAGRRARERDEAVDVGALARATADAWRPVALAAGGDVSCVAATREPALVRGDRVRLAQACGNLLANAIEHGGGRVEVRTESDARRVRVEFRDDGPGLPVAVPQLARRRRGGRERRGRGLAIAAEIAVRHGGRLACAPASRGARLVLELPAVPLSGAAPLPPGGSPAPFRARRDRAALPPVSAGSR
jgi:signal transduction histidine kinase